MLISVMLFSAIHMHTIPEKNLCGSAFSIAGYRKETLASGIIKFENPGSLVYLKALNVCNAEHNPLICWTGSGYEFNRINKVEVEGTEIYTGILRKGNDKIYTSWWFDNGKFKTISQIDWRWKVLKGEPDFCLVNVNAQSEKELSAEIKKLFSQNIFNQIENGQKISVD